MKIWIREMIYNGNDVHSYTAFKTYEDALADAKDFAQRAGDIHEVCEHRDAQERATVFCEAGHAIVIEVELQPKKRQSRKRGCPCGCWRGARCACAKSKGGRCGPGGGCRDDSYRDGSFG